ncbi:hypothetical protein EDB19DRAFT_1916525 [Suillus lakei]|nr:hypothetical protein EDB19DRAFT_1916525 [Suillus lakei]
MVEMLGHIPMVTQSDPGSENYGITNAHTMLCQWHDPALQGSLQHWWMRMKKNVMPEIAWSQMCRHFTPGFETLLDRGVTSSCILDFKIKLECEALDHVRDLYIDPSHVVFDLVPRPFSEFMECCYTELGRPLVTWQTAWDVYLHLLTIVQISKEIPHHIELYDEAEEELTILPLIENHQELPYHEDANGAYYVGGVGGGLGLVDEHLDQLDSLVCDDEPDITLGIDEDIVGLDHTSLVVWDFSDGEDLDVPDEW